MQGNGLGMLTSGGNMHKKPSKIKAGACRSAKLHYKGSKREAGNGKSASR